MKDSDMRELLERLEGFTVALDTPLTAGYELDVPALERMIERVIEAGTRCVFLMGWIGQGPLLPDRVRAQLVRQAARIINGRVLLMAGVSEQSLPRALELADAVKQAGADVILSTPPYSYHSGPDQVYAYFKDLAAKSGMPLVVYYNSEVGGRIDLALLQRLGETSGVIGVKSFCDFNMLQQWFARAQRPGRFAVFCASAYHIGPALLVGFNYFMVGAPGNLMPKLCARMIRNAEDGNWEAVRQDHRRVIELCNTLFLDTGAGDAAVKFALSELGLCEPHVIPPLEQLPEDKKDLVRKAMKDYADLVG